MVTVTDNENLNLVRQDSGTWVGEAFQNDFQHLHDKKYTQELFLEGVQNWATICVSTQENGQTCLLACRNRHPELTPLPDNPS